MSDHLISYPEIPPADEYFELLYESNLVWIEDYSNPSAKEAKGLVLFLNEENQLVDAYYTELKKWATWDDILIIAEDTKTEIADWSYEEPRGGTWICRPVLQLFDMNLEQLIWRVDLDQVE